MCLCICSYLIVCTFIEFKPPQIFTQHFENGTLYASWSLLPDQELSIDYLNYLLYGWFLSGNCTNNSIVLVSKYMHFCSINNFVILCSR